MPNVIRPTEGKPRKGKLVCYWEEEEGDGDASTGASGFPAHSLPSPPTPTPTLGPTRVIHWLCCHFPSNQPLSTKRVELARCKPEVAMPFAFLTNKPQPELVCCKLLARLKSKMVLVFEKFNKKMNETSGGDRVCKTGQTCTRKCRYMTGVVAMAPNRGINLPECNGIYIMIGDFSTTLSRFPGRLLGNLERSEWSL